MGSWCLAAFVNPILVRLTYHRLPIDRGGLGARARSNMRVWADTSAVPFDILAEKGVCSVRCPLESLVASCSVHLPCCAAGSPRHIEGQTLGQVLDIHVVGREASEVKQ